MPLPRCCRADRDQPDAIASPRVDNHKNAPERVDSNRYPPLFAIPAFVVQSTRVCVLQDESGIGELDAMLAQIQPCFLGVPLDARVRVQVYTTRRYAVRPTNSIGRAGQLPSRHR